jgi:hypothetical protein
MPARLSGTVRTDASSDQLTAHRAASLAFTELEQAAIQAESDHDRTNSDCQRGEQSEM